MVVFVDFESEDDDPYSSVSLQNLPTSLHRVSRLSKVEPHETSHNAEADVRKEVIANPHASQFASVLACYPASLSIAAQLDLNDLYSLSFTCRKVHHELSQFARQLRTESLRCINDAPPKTSEEEIDAIIFQEAMHDMIESAVPGAGQAAFPLPSSTNHNQFHINQTSALGSTGGKVGTCARDLVAPCRKCGVTVCRNCAAKPPSDRCLPNRHRRLCSTCLDAPLVDHLQSLSNNHDFHDSPPNSSASSARSVRSASSSSSCGDHDALRTTPSRQAFTLSILLREPCRCASRGVYLCQPCGQSLNSNDTTYKRVWTWRSRYSTHIGGGLGTGLGLGNQGQKCARGEYCLERGAAGVCWVEIECSEARAQGLTHDEGSGISRTGTPSGGGYESDGPSVHRPGYLSQELEGIGGVLKKKVKKRIKVGATVYEYDDERETGKYLQRECSGKQRSWCGWCSRVCPSDGDKAEADQLLGR